MAISDKIQSYIERKAMESAIRGSGGQLSANQYALLSPEQQKALRMQSYEALSNRTPQATLAANYQTQQQNNMLLEQQKRKKEAMDRFRTNPGIPPTAADLMTILGPKDYLTTTMGGKDTSLIGNVKYIDGLYEERDKYEVNSKPYNDLTTTIRNAEAGIGAYKYDTGRQSELTYGKTAAEQGRLGKSVLSKGELKSDEAFGTWYTNEWLLKGGGSTEQTYLESLKGVRNTLADAEQSGESISGVGQGILSKYPTAQAYFNPEGAVVQDRIASVAQLSLKAILGGQFSEREGELLIQRAYNPLLSEAENIERLTQLINRIEKAENYKKSAVDYWEENKSMSGFKAPKYGEEDFRSDIESYYRQDMKLLSDDALRSEFMRVPEDSIYFKILSEEYKKRNG